MPDNHPTDLSKKSTPARLLIVDDNIQFGASLVTLFQRCGFTAATVRNGRSALQYLSQQHVDILITDIFMPNGDGLELLSELYKRRILMRVVAMTGGEDANMPDMLQVATLMGAECTIPKPFEPRELLAMVRGMLAAPGPVMEPIKVTHA